MDLKIVFSDFDGTLTIDGALGTHFLQLLRLLEELQLTLVIVSGGSLSLGHFLLAHFPLRICVMEGGGVVVRKGEGGVLTEEILVSEADMIRLKELEEALEKKFPGVLTVDSFGRKTDRAIDLKFVNKTLMSEIKTFLANRGAFFSSSNIHLNFWYGGISKYHGIEYVLKNDFPEVDLDDCIYFGDAPNDQTVFRNMKYTVGVSNIARFLDQMEYHPEVILRGDHNRSVKGVYNFLKSLK